MTGSELYDYIINTLKRTDKSTEVYEAITDTVTAVRRKRPAEDFKTTADLSISASDYRVALPADFGHLLGRPLILEDDDSYPLTLVSKEDIDEIESYPDYANVDTNKPGYCAIYGGFLYIAEPSDDSYTIRIKYTTETDDLTVVAGTDPVPFSERYRELLKAGTLYRMFRDLGLDNEAVKWKSEYMELYGEYEDIENGNLRQQPRNQRYQDI